MDVLYCIVLGYGNVKQIIKILKQPQSTISTKLQFLRKKRIVNKNKWTYTPNWTNICSIMGYLIEECLTHHRSFCKAVSGNSKKSKKEAHELWKIIDKIEDYFPKDLLKKILIAYASFYFHSSSFRITPTKRSLTDIVQYFLVSLTKQFEKPVKHLDEHTKKYLWLVKKAIGYLPGIDEIFFNFVVDDFDMAKNNTINRIEEMLK